MLAGPAGEVGRTLEQDVPLDTGDRLGVGHPIPQSQRPLVVTECARRREHFHGGAPGEDRGCQCVLEFAGGVPMLGYRLSGRPTGRWPERRLLGERPGHGPVQLLALAREQLGINSLPGERMPKRIPVTRRITDE